MLSKRYIKAVFVSRNNAGPQRQLPDIEDALSSKEQI
jgi:hypothetical protein